MHDLFHNLYLSWNGPPAFEVAVEWVTTLALLVLSSYVLSWLTQGVISQLIRHLVSKTHNQWDDYLFDKLFFRRLAGVLPSVASYVLIRLFLEPDPTVYPLVLKVILLLMCISFTSFAEQVITNVEKGFLGIATQRKIPIRSYVQVAKILLFLVSGILIVSVILDQNPVIILSGIGALTAVLLLVFRDSILGFVASLQLNTNDLVQLGDVIEIPAQNIDGEVIEISLSVVKIRSGDQTIYSVPTYQLISAPFKNWRHVAERGARRIRLSFPVDAASLKPSLSLARPEQTNLDAFRLWAQDYLENHADMNHDLARVVRIGDPAGRGIPVEMVFYTKLTTYPDWEHLHSHLVCLFLAKLPEFGLEVFQEPTGKWGPSTPSR